MKRIHIAITISDLTDSIIEYSTKFGTDPICTVKDTWALWLTPELNFSIEVKPEQAGEIKHIGFEDPSAESMIREKDINGLEWENFTIEQQKELIFKIWPHAEYAIQ